MLQAFSLVALLFMSLLTLRDSFSCSGLFDECQNIKRSLVCKADLVPPLSLSFPFAQSKTSHAFVSISCGWESAKSQIRVCIILCSLYATYMAYGGTKKENRKDVDSYLSAAMFISFLLITTSFFDLIATIDSINDNTPHCSFNPESNLRDIGAIGEQVNCSFLSFYIIILIGFMAGLIVYYSHGVMAAFKKTIAIDGL